MIQAKVICDSITPHRKRITTLVLTYPRFIHAELMTHRTFSRNSSSSRAIPFRRLVMQTIQNMAYPIKFKKNKPGMQAGEDLSKLQQLLAKMVWTVSGWFSCFFAYMLHLLGAHKQYCNRLIEPYSHITVVVTATEWANFFALRYHKDAQPEIKELAALMWKEMKNSEPNQLDFGKWHLPFVGIADIVTAHHIYDFVSNNEKYWYFLCMLSAARCARTSYLTHDKKQPTLKNDLALFDRLVAHRPMHASPTEHQATPAISSVISSGNFQGWIQFRKTLGNENITTFDGPSDD